MDHKTLIDELKAQARAALRQDKNRAELFAAMVRTEAWKNYHALLTEKVEAMGSELLSPSDGVDGVLRGEFSKGTMYAFLLARDLPSVIIAAMAPESSQEE